MTPLVLLHGLGDDSRTWQPILPALAAAHGGDGVQQSDHDALTGETRHVHALDLRGHGGGPYPGEYSFELMRDDVIAFLEGAGIDSCVLLGHSMGGTVAILVAEKAPHLVGRLILEDVTAPRPGAFSRPPLEPPDEPTPFDFAVVNAIRAQLNDPDPAWWDDMAAITVPTLIIGGANSKAVPQHLLAETVARMPDARLVTLDAGHDVHEERPAEFVAAISAWLR